MGNRTLRVLLIESDPRDVRASKRKLASASVPIEVTHAGGFEATLQSLGDKHFDVILLGMRNRQELDHLAWVHSQTPDIPIVVLGKREDPRLAVQVVRRGAQDYLAKPNLRGALLLRSIRYAVERHHLRKELRALSLQDKLTGLYNRNGFVILAEQQLTLARRLRRHLVLVFADVDGLKQINDTFGHSEGDSALRRVAVLLKGAFRRSDVIARLGGDEFAVVAMETENTDGAALIARLRSHLDALESRRSRRYSLSLSFGMVRYDPEHPKSLAELLTRADRMMYNEKQRKKATRKR